MSHKAAPQDGRTELIEHVERWSTFFLANLLWGIFSIPIVTMPASTAGLFVFMSGRVRGKQVEMFQAFFGGMRRYWWKSALLVLLDLVIGGIVVFNFIIFPQMNSSDPLLFLTRSITVFVGVALLIVNLYAWPLLVILDPPVKQLLDNSIRLMFIYPLYSLGVLFLALLPIALGFLLPRIILLIGAVSLSVLIVNMGAWRVIRRHLPQDVLDSL